MREPRKNPSGGYDPPIQVEMEMRRIVAAHFFADDRVTTEDTDRRYEELRLIWSKGYDAGREDGEAEAREALSEAQP